jgi:signal transduction histidine kinase
MLIRSAKEQIKAVWPPLRLRTILLGVLILVASLPGFAAIFLRVYENTLVQQTEAQLATASAAIVGAWADDAGPPLAPYMPSIDLTRLETLPAHIDGMGPAARPDRQAAATARVLMPMALRIAESSGAEVTLLDADAVPLPDGGQRLAGLMEVRKGLAGETATVLRARSSPYGAEPITRAANIMVVHVRPVRIDGRVAGLVLMRQEPRDVFAGIWADRWNIGFGAGTILLLLMLLAGLLSRAIGRPIEMLSAATGDVAQGSINIPPAPAMAAMEIKGLFESFGIMADRVDRRTRYLRDFAAAMSHEFKTPLTGIRGVMELIEEHGNDMDEAERSRFLANAQADADRLSRLVERLLELARADMADPVACAALAARPVLDQVAGIETSRLCAISVRGHARMAVPEQALVTVAQALIDNSRKAGASVIEIGLRMDGDTAVMLFQDNGPGVPPADAARIFEPFFTNRRETGGTGLGLPIVRSLVSASGGSITLMQSSAGACFELRIPAGPRWSEKLP